MNLRPSLLVGLALVAIASEARAADPGRTAEMAAEAQEMVDRGDLGGAESKLKLALEIDRASCPANVVSGTLKLIRNDLPGAAQAANICLGADKKNPAALILLVRVQTAQGTIDTALPKYAEVANTHRQDVGAQLAYGEALQAAKKYDDAIAAATRVLKLQETSVPAMKLLARAYIGLDRRVTAESILFRALELDRDPEALPLLAGIRTADANVIEARIFLEEAVQKLPGYVEALNSLGATYIAVRNFDSAIETLQRALAMAPSFADAWINLGGAQRGAGYFDQAEVAWKKALALDSRMADAWFNLGILYLENPNAKRDRLQQLNDAVSGFNAYKRIGGRDPAVDKYLEEAATLIKQETENRQNQLKTPTPDG